MEVFGNVLALLAGGSALVHPVRFAFPAKTQKTSAGGIADGGGFLAFCLLLGEHGKQSFCLFKILRLFEPEIKRAQL